MIRKMQAYSIFSIISWLILVSGETHSAGLIARVGAGGGRLGQPAVTASLRNALLNVPSQAVGPTISAEINANDPCCQLPSQRIMLHQHEREHGHYGSTYAILACAHSRSVFSTAGGLTAVNFDVVTTDLLNLLFSGRVSFSVGPIQIHPHLPHDHSFCIFANLNGHGIANLNAVAGNYFGPGVGTNYLRIVLRFMDRPRTGLCALPPVIPRQLIFVTMFSENPASADLANSILPAPGGAGVAVGALPAGAVVDNRIPAVMPLTYWQRFSTFCSSNYRFVGEIIGLVVIATLLYLHYFDHNVGPNVTNKEL